MKSKPSYLQLHVVGIAGIEHQHFLSIAHDPIERHADEGEYDPLDSGSAGEAEVHFGQFIKVVFVIVMDKSRHYHE